MSGRAATIASNRAKKDKDDYEKMTGKKRSLKDLEDTNPLANAGDQTHWRNGLKGAGWL